MTRINVGYSAISGDAMRAWVAKDAGIFEKNELDVNSFSSPAAPRRLWLS
jgi:ABC-type nitrate/sulfonate/bicarbonate transport system substrate-binding protein